MKLTITIVDSLINLNNSNTIIPDGVIVKVTESNEFKIGNGINKYSDLPDNTHMIMCPVNNGVVGSPLTNPRILMTANENEAILLSSLHPSNLVFYPEPKYYTVSFTSNVEGAKFRIVE